MFLAPAATSAPFTALPQRNFQPINKPTLPSPPTHLASFVAPSPAMPPHDYSHAGESSSDVLIAEEQITRHQAARDQLPSALSLLLSSDVKSMEDRIRYVHQCLQAIQAQQSLHGAKGFTGGGPQEELAYAIQQLQSAITAKATSPQQRQQLASVIEHATRDSQQLTAAAALSTKQHSHSAHSSYQYDSSAPHRIVSEDVVPHTASTRELYHSHSTGSDGSNVLGYRKAHEESERLAREGDRRRIEYAVRCLQTVAERRRQEEEEQRRAAKQAGPEEQSAYNMISRQARAQALRSRL